MNHCAVEVEDIESDALGLIDDDRVLATVLFTDIVESTKQASQLGDRQWRALLDRHDQVVRHRIAHFRGHEVKNLGDGFLATFDGPARATRCAASIAQGVRTLGIAVRSGLHAGEIDRKGDDIGGIAVHIAARIAAAAAPGEALVSSTVRDLVAGSAICVSRIADTTRYADCRRRFISMWRLAFDCCQTRSRRCKFARWWISCCCLISTGRWSTTFRT